MFKLHILSIDSSSKTQKLIYKVFIRREYSKSHLIKNILFNIQSLGNQLYYSQLTIFKVFKSREIYFLEKPVLNLLKEGIK